jgi:outer membrane lipoprotein SlyB
MAESRNGVSPIVAIAATSITLFSLVGIGVLTGVIPSSYSRSAEQRAPAASVATPAPAPATASFASSAPEQRPTRERTARKPPEPTRVASAQPAARLAPPPVCENCGTVTSVNVGEKKGEGSGLGAVAGGLVGGVLGNQVGGGSGRKIATVAGVAGGALAGHELEKRYKSERHYEVAVRMDDGTVRHFAYDSEPGYVAGDKVRVVDGQLTR